MLKRGTDLLNDLDELVLGEPAITESNKKQKSLKFTGPLKIVDKADANVSRMPGGCMLVRSKRIVAPAKNQSLTDQLNKISLDEKPALNRCTSPKP